MRDSPVSNIKNKWPGASSAQVPMVRLSRLEASSATRNSVGSDSNTEVRGWNVAEREELQVKIAARAPFLDFVLSRVNTDGSEQRFQVSGEPIFNRSCGYIGYRGLGVELIAKKIEHEISIARHVTAA